MILPSVEEKDLPKMFPKGVDKVEMPSGKVYVRTTTNYWNPVYPTLSKTPIY